MVLFIFSPHYLACTMIHPIVGLVFSAVLSFTQFDSRESRTGKLSKTDPALKILCHINLISLPISKYDVCDEDAHL